MTQTFAQLTQRVIHAVGEVPGTSVQTYSEPRVMEALTQVFDVVFRKFWWPQYMRWFELTLDGTLGIVTDNSFGTSVVDIRDIKAVIPEDNEKGIPQLPDQANPFNLSGTTPLYYESLDTASSYYATRLLQFWPKTATGGVKIHARLKPTVVDSLVNYLDDNLIVFGATWVILEAEDINPNAAKLAQRMFNESFVDIMKQFADQPIENPVTGYPSSRYLSEWWPG